MFKIKNLLLIIAVLSLFGCSHMSRIRVQDLDYTNQDKEGNKNKIMIGFNFNHDGKQIHVGRGFLNQCWANIKDENDGFIKYKLEKRDQFGVSYLLIKSNTKTFYLHSVECLEYKVFYNKSRLKYIETNITTKPIQENKINYIGEVNIDWTPEGFRFYDLFTLGHMMIPDRGSFVIKVDDNYDQYKLFMKTKYNIDSNKLTNSVDDKIVANIATH